MIVLFFAFFCIFKVSGILHIGQKPMVRGKVVTPVKGNS